eukprot:71577-Alexandrium_andersonii.AAC.1
MGRLDPPPPRPPPGSPVAAFSSPNPGTTPAGCSRHGARSRHSRPGGRRPLGALWSGTGRGKN